VFGVRTEGYGRAISYLYLCNT